MPSRPAAMLSNFTMAVRGASHPFFFSYDPAVSRCGVAFSVITGKENRQAICLPGAVTETAFR